MTMMKDWLSGSWGVAKILKDDPQVEVIKISESY